eukprot:1172866-Prymnesium_polylepis.1
MARPTAADMECISDTRRVFPDRVREEPNAAFSRHLRQPGSFRCYPGFRVRASRHINNMSRSPDPEYMSRSPDPEARVAPEYNMSRSPDPEAR